MVFTVPWVLQGGEVCVEHTRRAVLAGLAGAGVAVALGGCWPRKDTPAAHPTPHSLTPVVAGTTTLIELYQSTLAANPDLGTRLEPLLREHRAHLDALRQAMGAPNPSGSVPASASAGPSVAADPTAATAALHAAEQTAQKDATTACLTAAAEYAPLLGSISACRATHVEVLA